MPALSLSISKTCREKIVRVKDRSRLGGRPPTATDDTTQEQRTDFVESGAGVGDFSSPLVQVRDSAVELIK